MVPGMAERERHAGNIWRAEWLADAMSCRTPQDGSFARLVSGPARLPSTERSSWRAVASWAFAVGRGMFRKILGPVISDRSLPESASAQIR
jgi:hypothetical protein